MSALITRHGSYIASSLPTERDQEVSATDEWTWFAVHRGAAYDRGQVKAFAVDGDRWRCTVDVGQGFEVEHDLPLAWCSFYRREETA